MKTGLSKKIALGLILGACVMAFAGAAHAATYVNLYGTNEEYTFWTNEGITLLSNFGCTVSTATRFLANPTTSGVIVGTNCTGLPDAQNPPAGGDNTANAIYFTFTNKASWDGIDAVNDFYDVDNWGTFNPNTGEYVPATNPCPAPNMRQVATCTAGGTSCTTVGNVCQDIHIGVSNLEASAIVQTTYGTLKGPIDPTDNPTFRQFPSTGAPYTGPATNNLPSSVTVPLLAGGNKTYPNPTAPLAYPFAFYVNPQVTTTRCNTSSPTTGAINSFCFDDTVCGGTATVAPFTYCVAQTIDNLSRLQAVALFSGAVANWNDFGGTYVNKPVTLCLRHAGAGTLSVLDVGLMQSYNSGWGASLVTSENRVNSGNPAPYIYFNDLVSDELNCLSWASGNTTFSGADTLPTSIAGGGVGIADADNANKANNYTEVKFNGVPASRVAMRDGIYDNFWTMDRLYVPTGLPQSVLEVYGEMLLLAGDPTQININTVGNPRQNYYGSTTELNYLKNTSTFYPGVYKAAPNQQQP